MTKHVYRFFLTVESENARGRRWTSLYQLRRLTDARHGWQLVQQLGQRPGITYEVWIDPCAGPRCSCDDFVCRMKAQSGALCKHLDALISIGIIPIGLVPAVRGNSAVAVR